MAEKKRAMNTAAYVILILGALLILFPLYITVVTTFKTSGESIVSVTLAGAALSGYSFDENGNFWKTPPSGTLTGTPLTSPCSRWCLSCSSCRPCPSR